MKKIRIALTGGIGSGKSTVADLLRQQGADVVSGDELGRHVLEQDAVVRDAIVEKFGQKVCNTDGSLNRKAIAAQVFADPQHSRWLTSLTFPGIYSRWQQVFDAAQGPVIVFDAALIFEWNVQDDFELVLVVAADSEIAFSRANRRFARDDFERRVSSQLSVEHKIANADYVIWNNGSPAELARHIEQIWISKIQPLIA